MITLFKNCNNLAIFKQFGYTPLLKQSFINLQRKGDITDLLIFINLVSASVYLVAFESLNKSIILFILFGYVGVKKKESITPVDAVVFVSVSTSGMVSAIFFSMLAKYALRFSEIAAGLVITSPVLVLSWLMSTCCEGFKFTNSFTIFQILPLLLLFSIINSL